MLIVAPAVTVAHTAMIVSHSLNTRSPAAHRPVLDTLASPAPALAPYSM